MFLFDTHVHTKEVSPCGSISAAQTISLYRNAGYSGLCITDHFNRRFFDSLHILGWDEAVKHYLSGYHKAKAAGEKEGLSILLGAEVQLDGSPNEYLLYGLTEAFLLAHPHLYRFSLEELRCITKESGILIFQAHPYRPDLTRALPCLLDGVEVINGNLRHNSHNDLAKQFAEQNRLLVSAGSDCHEIEDVGRSGINSSERIISNDAFVRILKSGDFSIIDHT